MQRKHVAEDNWVHFGWLRAKTPSELPGKGSANDLTSFWVSETSAFQVPDAQRGGFPDGCSEVSEPLPRTACLSCLGSNVARKHLCCRLLGKQTQYDAVLSIEVGEEVPSTNRWLRQHTELAEGLCFFQSDGFSFCFLVIKGGLRT